MTAEAAKQNDVPTKVIKTESHPHPVLHKEALAELSSSKVHTTANKTDTGKTKASVNTHKEVGNEQIEHKPAVKLKANYIHEAMAKAQADKADGSDINKTKKIEKGKLTAELKTAIDHASRVIVKMPSEKGLKADLVIKSDGSIIHTLDMDPKRAGNAQLTVGVESASHSGGDISKAQTDALKEIVEYGKLKNKDVKFVQPTAPAEIAKQEKPIAKNADDKSSVDDPLDNKVTAPARQSQPQEAAETVYKHHQGQPSKGSEAESVAHKSSPEPAERPLNFAPPTSPDAHQSASKPIDYSQVNLKELISDWFNANPEKFSQLMPELYKMLVGADGKLDQQKLDQLQETNSPLLEDLKKRLPSIAAEFPPSESSNDALASLSSDAVSPLGSILANKASQVASELCGSGYCAKGVSTAIERATGISITGNANDMRVSLPSHGFKEAPSKDLKVGQIIHVSWTPEVYAQERAKRGNCPNYGDIAVIGKGKDGQLYAFNDHATPLQDYLAKSRYDWNSMKVFNPPTA